MGRAKACNACRQLKLRCDAHEDNYASCSRCRKVQRDCVISTSFKRTSRQTKAELLRELDSLRKQNERPATSTSPADQPNMSSPDHSSGRIDMIEAPSSTDQLMSNHVRSETFPPALSSSHLNDVLLTPNISQFTFQNTSEHLTNWKSPQQHSGATLSSSFMSSVEARVGNIDPNQPSPGRSNASRTIYRAIDGVELSGQKVNDCFFLFFEYYSPSIPGIFNRDKTPNEFYEYSVFLFWAIVYVGARRYSKDPTIVEFLSTSLTKLAQQTLFDPEHAIPAIQAVLIICLWPLPIDSTFKDPTHAIAGAATHLAIQKGLPYASRKQDFAGVVLRESESDRLFRSRLWAYCLIVFQSTSLQDGIPFHITIDSAGVDQNISVLKDLPPIVLYKYRLHRIQTDAIAFIMRTVDLGSTGPSKLLNSLIENFDARTLQVLLPEADDLGENASQYHFCNFAIHRLVNAPCQSICRCTLCSARLMIRAFHFFSEPTSEHTSGLLQTYLVSCELIETAFHLNETQDFWVYCHISQARPIALAAVCILRLLRSSLRTHVNVEVGEEMFFNVIRMFKRRSIQNNDLDARYTKILTQLWSSTRLFRYRDGSVDGLRLLLRGRMSMSVLHDCFWWWRTEFGGTSNPYIEPESGPTSRSSGNDAAGMSNAQAEQQTGNYMSDSTSMNLAALPDLPVHVSEFLDWNFGADLNWNWP